MQMRKILLFLIALISYLISFGQSMEGKDYALFFVTTDFDYWGDFPQSTARQVEAIAQELKANYGFQTELVYNPTRREILTKIAAYQKKQFSKQDQLLVYFSQHGHYEEGAAGALIPKDGQKGWLLEYYGAVCFSR